MILGRGRSDFREGVSDPREGEELSQGGGGVIPGRGSDPSEGEE